MVFIGWQHQIILGSTGTTETLIISSDKGIHHTDIETKSVQVVRTGRWGHRKLVLWISNSKVDEVSRVRSVCTKNTPLSQQQSKEKTCIVLWTLPKNWGLLQQKVFLINYDEKCSFGWVCRVNAKKCELLGLNKTHTYLYHKVHIDKLMAVALTGFLFDGNMDKGGVGVKLGIYCVQGAWVAKKTVRIFDVTERDASSTMVKSCAIKEMRTWWLELW